MDSPEALPLLYSALPTVFYGCATLFCPYTVKNFLFDGVELCNAKNLENAGDAKFAAKMVCAQMIARSKTSKGLWVLRNSVMFAYFHDVS